MTEYYHIVPWYNSDEWKHVYEEVFSLSSNSHGKSEALRLLLVWKARCPSLPSGVESTLTLLAVHLQDISCSRKLVNDNILRLAYSSAIMRFVNHTLDTETAKGNSLYQAAKSLGLPDWIIDMRHDTAHSNNLPSLELLRDACNFGLEWLRVNYWEKYSECIQDYITGQVEVDDNDDSKIETLMNFCFSLSICAHSKCKIKNLSAIPNPDMRESIMNDAKDLFPNLIDMSSLKSTSVMSLINIMNNQAKKILKSADNSLYVKKALLGNDSIFLSRELLDFLGEGSTKKKKELSKSYVQCFEIMLTFLHTHDLLLDFTLELIKISQSNDHEAFKRRLAALWVAEILKSLRRCKNFSDRMKKAKSGEISRRRKELKSLFHHWYPNESVNCLILDLEKTVPDELADINFIQPIISEYNPLLTIFIKDLLLLVQPSLPKETIDQICKLARLIAAPERSLSANAKIYTVDDLNNDKEYGSDKSDSDCFEVTEVEATPVKNNSQISFGIWALASRELDWKNCPIGQLPWQQHKATAPAVPMDVS